HHGQAFTRFGKLNLRNAKHGEDLRPLDETSGHEALNKYSRAYLHHLVRANEILGMMLLSWANIAYYQELMAGMRKAIEEDRFEAFKTRTIEGWEKGS
ncbi:MAG TPA: tRNA-guanine transglycosylase, partial [Rhizobiales bacterium]|nr:tRNA-guanine transglycosylase [Hyphomicrobiales bacterium]